MAAACSRAVAAVVLLSAVMMLPTLAQEGGQSGQVGVGLASSPHEAVHTALLPWRRAVNLSLAHLAARSGNESFGHPSLMHTGAYERFIIVPEHKLMFCFIEKVACKSFNALFSKLREPYDSRQGQRPWWRNTPSKHNMDDADVERLLQDPSWHKAVFYREPLERFLSAFKSKCEPGHDRDGELRCTFSFPTLKYPPTFADTVGLLGSSNHRFEPHFVEQHLFCGGLESTLQYFQTVVELREATSHDTVKELLLKVGVSDVRAEELLSGTFPRPGKSICRSCHETKSRRMLAKYYNAALAKRVVSYFLRDYLLLGISLPTWVRPMLNTSDENSEVRRQHVTSLAALL